MANNYASGTFAPFIPANLITDEFKLLAKAVGVSIEPTNDDDNEVYLFNEDYCTSGYIEKGDGTEKEVSDEDLYAAIQDIIRRSEGRLAWVLHEQAYTCDKMRKGEFGGSAVFITADDIQYHGTSSWLERRIHEAETGDFGPDTEDPAETPKDIFRDGPEALLPDGMCANDYVLSEKHKSAWVAIGNVSVHVSRKDDGVSVSLYPRGVEDSDSIGETWATFAECETDDTGLFCGVLPQNDTPHDVKEALNTILPEGTTVNVNDVIEATNDLIAAAKVVVERWENGDLAQAVANLGVVIGWTEKTLEDYTPAVAPQPGINLELLEACRALLEVQRARRHPLGTPDEGIATMCVEAACKADRAIERAESANPIPINLAVILDGGLVQAVVTDAPEAFKGVNTMIIDYDTDCLDKDDESLGIVLQDDGALAAAYIRATSVESAGIDLARTADFVFDKAYGANQERFAICDINPCEGCKDCNSDGERCVNEDKCLAWQYYNN